MSIDTHKFNFSRLPIDWSTVDATEVERVAAALNESLPDQVQELQIKMKAAVIEDGLSSERDGHPTSGDLSQQRQQHEGEPVS